MLVIIIVVAVDSILDSLFPTIFTHLSDARVQAIFNAFHFSDLHIFVCPSDVVIVVVADVRLAS